QERLELRIGAVELVDEQHDGLLARQRAEQRPREEKALVEERRLLRRDAIDGLAERLRAGEHTGEHVLDELRVEQLLAVLPLVERLALVEALVALEPHELAARRARHGLRELRLADAGRALEEERLAERAREVRDDGELAVRDVAARAELRERVVGAL